ncbi:MAG TPA: hypothetical protein DD400_00890 [Rhodospirillaceae bacterium]|nr:hypothetical protein [Rhodospirillaceae bacterium]
MRNLLFFLALLALLVGPMPVHADKGDLIPPDNKYSKKIPLNTKVGCPNGKVLGWTGGSVACIDPTLGVSTGECPSGQVMTKIVGKTPTCKYPVNAVCKEGQAIRILGPNSLTCIDVGGTTEMNIDCRTAGYALRAVGINGNVTCIDVSSLTAMCPVGYFLTGIRNGEPNCLAPAVVEGDYRCPENNSSEGYGLRKIDERGHYDCEHLRSTNDRCPPGYAINKIAGNRITKCVYTNGIPDGTRTWRNGKCLSGEGAVGISFDGGSSRVYCGKYNSPGREIAH